MPEIQPHPSIGPNRLSISYHYRPEPLRWYARLWAFLNKPINWRF